MKSQAEVEDLKRQWELDPCWDIEGTEGFEEYHDELLTYRKEQEQKWQQDYIKCLEQKAEQLGCPGNIALAEYINKLENRITTLENILQNIARLGERK